MHVGIFIHLLDVNIEIHALIDYKSYRSVWNGTSFNFIYCEQFLISASYLTQEVLLFKDIALLTNTDYRNDFVVQLMWLIKGYSHLIIYYSWFSFPFSTGYCKFSHVVYLFFYVNYLPEYNFDRSLLPTSFGILSSIYCFVLSCSCSSFQTFFSKKQQKCIMLDVLTIVLIV